MSDVQPSSDNRPVVMLIHGATLNGRMWDPARRFLDPHYRVITPDLPGHGSRMGERYTLEGSVQTVLDAVRDIGSAPLILGGDSLGGYTSLAAASALPAQQLKGLVIGGASFNFEGAEIWPYQIKGRFFRALGAVFGDQRLIEKSATKVFGEGPKKVNIPPHEVRAILDRGMNTYVFLDCVREMTGVDFRSKVEAIRQPILFVNGDKDKPNVRHEASFLAAAKHGSVHRFDCEHGVSLWRFEEFAQLINRFAASVLAPSSVAA